MSRGVTGKWEETGNDLADATSALRIAAEPGELAFLLIQLSLTLALVELVRASARQLSSETADTADAVLDEPGQSLAEVHVGHGFFERPADLPVIDQAKDMLRQWLLAARGLNAPLQPLW